ncbi:Uncharacterised protein [Chlamydia abortus]|nr:Uncharacterised protein [Chlamydia abortus]
MTLANLLKNEALSKEPGPVIGVFLFTKLTVLAPRT